MKKFPKIKRMDDEANSGILNSGTVVIEEKLDGANFRFFHQRHLDEEYHDDDRTLVFGSRNVIYKNEKDVDSAFEHAIEYVREFIDYDEFEWYDDHYDGIVVYGEALHTHTLDYDAWDGRHPDPSEFSTPNFVLFDVWSESREQFLHESIRNKDRVMGLQTVPLIYYGSPDSIPDTLLGDDDSFDIPDSEFRDGVAEGIVVKNLATGQRAKTRSEEFLERHDTARRSNGNGQVDPNDSVVLANQFTTEARVKKHIYKMRDRGHEVEMSMMEDLWQEVFKDIIEEEFETIFLGDYEIETKRFRSEVASICADVLQSHLSEQDELSPTQ